jgi:hypothetical protein
MQFFGNLRVAARLAIGFGTLAVGLLLVGVVAIAAMGGLKAHTSKLGSHDLTATRLAGEVAQRSATIGHLVAQHLYVHDGELDAQDALADRIDGLSAQSTREGQILEHLLGGSSAAAAMHKFAATRDAFNSSWREALKRSRRETVAGAENRDGSRNLYTDQVAPASRAAASRSSPRRSASWPRSRRTRPARSPA